MKSNNFFSFIVRNAKIISITLIAILIMLVAILLHLIIRDATIKNGDYKISTLIAYEEEMTEKDIAYDTLTLFYQSFEIDNLKLNSKEDLFGIYPLNITYLDNDFNQVETNFRYVKIEIDNLKSGNYKIRLSIKNRKNDFDFKMLNYSEFIYITCSGKNAEFSLYHLELNNNASINFNNLDVDYAEFLKNSSNLTLTNQNKKFELPIAFKTAKDLSNLKMEFLGQENIVGNIEIDYQIIRGTDIFPYKKTFDFDQTDAETKDDNTIYNIDFCQLYSINKLTINFATELENVTIKSLKFFNRKENFDNFNLVAEKGFDNKIMIVWNKIPNADNYRVYYKNDLDLSYSFKETTKRIITINDIKNYEMYNFYVVATKNNVKLCESKIITTSAISTSAPTNPEINFVNRNGEVFVYWQKCLNAEYYNVYVNNGKYTTTKNTKLVVENLTNGENYDIKISSVNGITEKFSNIVTAKPNDDLKNEPKALLNIERLDAENIKQIELTNNTETIDFDTKLLYDYDYSTGFVGESQTINIEFNTAKNLQAIVLVPNNSSKFTSYNLKLFAKENEINFNGKFSNAVEKNCEFYIIPIDNEVFEISSLSILVDAENFSLTEIIFIENNSSWTLEEKIDSYFTNSLFNELKKENANIQNEISALKAEFNQNKYYYKNFETIKIKIDLLETIHNKTNKNFYADLQPRNGEFSTLNATGRIIDSKNYVYAFVSGLENDDNLTLVFINYNTTLSDCQTFTLTNGFNKIYIPSTDYHFCFGSLYYSLISPNNNTTAKINIFSDASSFSAIPMLDLSQNFENAEQIKTDYINIVKNYYTMANLNNVGNQSVRNLTEISLKNVLLSLPCDEIYKIFDFTSNDTLVQLDNFIDMISNSVDAIYQINGVFSLNNFVSRQHIRIITTNKLKTDGKNIGIDRTDVADFVSANKYLDEKYVSVISLNINKFSNTTLENLTPYLVKILKDNALKLTNDYTKNYSSMLDYYILSEEYDANYLSSMLYQLYLAYSNGTYDFFGELANTICDAEFIYIYRNFTESENDIVAIALCQITKHNLIDFFKTAKFAISTTTKNYINSINNFSFETRKIQYFDETCLKYRLYTPISLSEGFSFATTITDNVLNIKITSNYNILRFLGFEIIYNDKSVAFLTEDNEFNINLSVYSIDESKLVINAIDKLGNAFYTKEKRFYEFVLANLVDKSNYTISQSPTLKIVTFNSSCNIFGLVAENRANNFDITITLANSTEKSTNSLDASTKLNITEIETNGKFYYLFALNSIEYYNIERIAIFKTNVQFEFLLYEN